MDVRRITGMALLGSLLVGHGLPPALPGPSRAEELPPAEAPAQPEPVSPQPPAPQRETPQPASPSRQPAAAAPQPDLPQPGLPPSPQPDIPQQAPPPLPPLPTQPAQQAPAPAKPKPQAPATPPRSAPAAPAPGGGTPAAAGPVALLLIDLSEQRLTAFDGEGRRLYRALVSTGLASMPTPAGQFRVAGKYASTPIVGEGYRIPAVAHVMCLGGGGLRPDRICIHPAPWQEAARQAFGVRRSHGCIRVSSTTARWLFQRTPAGTEVRIER